MNKEATVLLIVLMICSLSVGTVTATESTTAEARLEPPTANLTAPSEGKAPSVEATEVEQAVPVFRDADDGPSLRPNHPPIDQIPSMPMPQPQEIKDLPKPEESESAVYHDALTGQTVVVPMEPGPAYEGVQQGGSYSGADGGNGSELIPATFNDMYQVNPGIFPWRMNVKLVMRFGSSYSVASGTMRDAETVLTAGHCVYDHGGYGWADEIWVYPGWDGAVTGDNAENFGWGHGTHFASLTGWTNNGDFDYDLGVIEIDRGVGMLTGWYGWSYGGDCSWHTSQTYNNPSYPAENCPISGLHNGEDMYYWFGNFDSCPGHQLQLNTGGGNCFDTVWGGMSGSGAYYIDGGSRYVHGVCSTSNRNDIGRYCEEWESFVTYTDNTFIPGARGSAFDLQALDTNAGPSTIKQGGSTTLLNHFATNPTNGNKAATFTVRVYLSTNDNISPADTLLSTQYHSWTFNPMSSVRVNMDQVTIPYSTPPGDYWIGVIYDSATDGNSANNDADGWDAVPIHVIKETTPPPPPAISSSTHPVENTWYCNRNPTFTWTTPSDPSGIACYSYTLDHSSSTTPDTICDTTGNSKSYTNLAYSTWYFHVRAKDNAGNWGSADHYRVQLDDCDAKDGCYVYGNGCEDRDYYCGGSVCTYTYSNRHTDYYGGWVNYCSGDTVRKHRMFHNFYCEGGTCTDHTSWKDDQLVEDCNLDDDWYNTGDTQWIDDPNNACKEKEQKKQEYRDYTCSGGSCTYSVTSTQWVDTGTDRNKPDGTDCGSDYYDDWVNYCSGDEVWKHRLFHDFYCEGGTCTDHTSWVDDQLVEDCNVHDNWYDTGDTQWIDDPNNACKEKEQKKQEYRDYTCSGGSCTYSVTSTQWVDTGTDRNKPDGTDCGSDYYDDWVNYCSGDEVWKHRMFHDFYCEGGTCTDHTSWKDDQLVEDCNLNDNWYDTGDTQWIDDPNNACKEKEQKKQEYRDYTCSGGSCTYSVTSTQWVDTGTDRNKPDGTDCGSDYYDNWVNYCNGDAVWEHRMFHDFYCEGGTCTDHTSWENDTLVEDCNLSDDWYNTGDTQWIDDPANSCKEKEQKEQEYRDYTCSGGSCTYSVTTTQWVDTGNVRNKPDGTICGCTENNTLKTCYNGNCSDTGVCNATHCDADANCNGRRPGDSCGSGSMCNATCKCITTGMLCGDVDDSGTVTIIDVRLLMNHVADPIGYPVDSVTGNVDGVGGIDMADVQLLVAHVFNPAGHLLNCK